MVFVVRCSHQVLKMKTLTGENEGKVRRIMEYMYIYVHFVPNSINLTL